MMRRAFETVAMDRLRRIGEACPPCLPWVPAVPLFRLQSEEPRLQSPSVTPQCTCPGRVFQHHCTALVSQHATPLGLSPGP